jgi:pimeloyl-ACP methyl ester carboxylesterase
MARERINGVELYYEVAGTNGPPLVLVHGSWGDHHNWNAVVPLLARSFRVLTYDRRGHSQSERPAGQGSVHDDTADLAALIEAAGLAPAHVAGNSGGSAVVLRLACVRPDLFRSLVVHEPALAKLLAGDDANAPLVATLRERIDRVATLLAAGDMEAGARLFVEEIAIGPGAWEKLPAKMRGTFVFNAPTFLDECRDPDDSTMDLAALAAFDAVRARVARLTRHRRPAQGRRARGSHQAKVRRSGDRPERLHRSQAVRAHHRRREGRCDRVGARRRVRDSLHQERLRALPRRARLRIRRWFTATARR